MAACGSGSSSSPPPAPNPPLTQPPASTTWSATGRVIDTVGRQPLPSIQISPSWELASVTTAADGTFSISSASNPPTNPYRLNISGPGLVSRSVWVSWQSGPRTGVEIDVIRDAAPFSLGFYQNFVRGTFDQPGAPYAVLRWMDSPRFYVKTVDQNGRAIEPEVLQVVRDAIARAVPAFTGGRLSVAVLDTGTEDRPPTSGWVNVHILRDPNERARCGFASVGANPGSITLYNDLCSCGSVKIPGSTVMHEVGHALGFFHVPDNRSVMFPTAPGNCPPGQLSAAEQFHAAIAYSRPRGNLEPDIDPSTSRTLTGPPLVIER